MHVSSFPHPVCVMVNDEQRASPRLDFPFTLAHEADGYFQTNAFGSCLESEELCRMPASKGERLDVHVVDCG